MRDKPNNQYDSGNIIKEVGDFEGQHLRVVDSRSAADQYYSHFRTTYNGSDLPTQVTYYRGTSPNKTNITCTADVAGSLNNKYFFIYDNPSDTKYHVWFNVSGAGVNPAPANSTAIEVTINTNDPAIIVAAAIALTINAVYSRKFKPTRNGSVVEIETVKYGLVTASSDFNTGFSIINTLGTQVITNKIDITYDGSDPIYEGQTLKGYTYDIYSGKFIPATNSSGGSSGVTKIKPFGNLAMPDINRYLTSSQSYDEVESDYDSGTDVETMYFYTGGTETFRIIITYSTNGWNITKVDTVLNYILQEDGDFLLQENGDRIIF